MVIDLTGYFGSWPYWKTPIQESDELLELMDEHGIDRLALCSTRGIFDDWRAGNEEILELASAQPRRFIPFVTFGPTSGDRFWEPLASQKMIDLLQQYQEKGVRGLRLFPQHQGFELNEDYYMEPVLAEAAPSGNGSYGPRADHPELGNAQLSGRRDFPPGRALSPDQSSYLRSQL